jgi:hypothetical protein
MKCCSSVRAAKAPCASTARTVEEQHGLQKCVAGFKRRRGSVTIFPQYEVVKVGDVVDEKAELKAERAK